jgi:ankyrin repeat protein
MDIAYGECMDVDANDEDENHDNENIDTSDVENTCCVLSFQLFMRQKSSILWKASLTGDDYTVKELLSNKEMDIDVTFQNFTPLMVAIKQGHINVVEMLLEGGADSITPRSLFGAEDMTALMLAAMLGHIEITNLLLKKSSTLVNKINSNNSSALDYAVSRNYLAVSEMLIRHGADPNIADPDNGHTSLFNATRENLTEMVRFLIDHGANIKHEDKFGDTAIDNAVFNQNIEVVEMFLDSGFDLNHKNKKGVTILHTVGKYNHANMARFLSTKAVCFGAHTLSGRTPCDTARFHESDEVLAIYEEEILRRTQLEAFCMGLHERLGVGSRIRSLDADIVRMVCNEF